MAEIAPQHLPMPETAADELRFARVLARRTKVEVAELLGKDPATIGRWESNDHPSEPTITQWRKMAAFLHAPWLNSGGGGTPSHLLNQLVLCELPDGEQLELTLGPPRLLESA